MEKPATREHFSVAGHRKDGTVRLTYCRECDCERSRARYRRLQAALTVEQAAVLRETERLRGQRRRKEDPDANRRAAREYSRRMCADPDRRRERAENERIDRRLRAERDGRVVTRTPRGVITLPETVTMLPVAPFRAWLSDLLAAEHRAAEWEEHRLSGAPPRATTEAVADLVGISGRNVRRIVSGETATIHLADLDAAYTHAGAPELLHLHYAECLDG